MKLTDLKPRWTGYPGPIYDGISFLCPHCMAQRLAINFRPAIDPNLLWDKIVQPSYEGKNVWKRISGDSFDNLSINPSVDASDAIEFKNHWHGFIIDGEIK